MAWSLPTAKSLRWILPPPLNCALSSADARIKQMQLVQVDRRGDELRAIKRYLATRTDQLPWLFLSERGQPLTRSSVQYLVRAAGEIAGLRGRSPAHAAALVRLSCRQGHRPAHHAGLSRASRPQAYRAIHSRDRASLRRAMEIRVRGGLGSSPTTGPIRRPPHTSRTGMSEPRGRASWPLLGSQTESHDEPALFQEQAVLRNGHCPPLLR